MLTDFYELTMMQGFLANGDADKLAVFDLFFRSNPCGNGYTIAAGLDQVIEYLKNLRFTDDDISYLKGCGCFKNDFLEYLKGFRFNGEVYAMPEGTVVFPKEPIIRVKAPLAEAQLIETALLNIVNHQSLIATKAARVVWATGGDPVLDMGLRRSQGPDAGLYGARASVIGGCSGTSNVLAGKMFGIPVRGTMAHSWIMNFPDEYTAFKKYAEIYPENCLLLVDTYNTLESGVPNAIRVFQELKDSGNLSFYGIRLDSGDFAYLPKKVRAMLDEAGFHDAIISASNDLDEYIISDLKLQGTRINLWGVGTRMITSHDCPAMGGVYKLAAEIDKKSAIYPKIKLSESPVKITNPGIKKVFRLVDNSTNKAKGDLIALDDEKIDETEDLTIFDPDATWKKMTLKGGKYTAKELLVPVFANGECVYESPTVLDIREYCRGQLMTLWDEHKRLINPQIYPVDLSQKLFDLKKSMISAMTD